jgi:hypothetical protein
MEKESKDKCEKRTKERKRMEEREALSSNSHGFGNVQI